jgi:hypothetical protein
MNRKFHNSLLALSTTGLALVLGLMVATPVLPTPDNGASTSDDLALVQRPDAHVVHVEVELRQVGETDVAAIDHTRPVVVDIPTEAALAATLARLETAVEAHQADPAAAAAERSPRRNRARSAIATPYFSFAHGLRGNGA